MEDHKTTDEEYVLFSSVTPECMAIHGACEEERGTWLLPSHPLPYGYAKITYTQRSLHLLPTCNASLLLCVVDLKTMSERLKSRYYTTRKLFMADMQRIFTNCREYNPPESEYYKCANLLEKFFYTKIKEAGLIDK